MGQPKDEPEKPQKKREEKPLKVPKEKVEEVIPQPKEKKGLHRHKKIIEKIPQEKKVEEPPKFEKEQIAVNVTDKMVTTKEIKLKKESSQKRDKVAELPEDVKLVKKEHEPK